MVTLVLFAIGIAFIGERISSLTWRRTAGAPMSGAERFSSASLCAILFWVFLSWSLALAGALHRQWLLLSVVVVAIALTFLSLRKREREAAPIAARDELSGPRPFRLAIVIALIPIVLWTGFLFWKGYVTPPSTHDALVYHLPRAALLAQTGTYQTFHFPDNRIDQLPPNYELLLATIISISGHDRFTAAFNTILFLLFLIQTAALARRWWGPGIHQYVVVLVVASTPLMLLHGASHKNDLLVAYLFVAAFLWCGRWLRDGEWPAALWTILATTAAAGAKPHGLILGALLAPVLIWGAVLAWRKGRTSSRHLGAIVLASVLAFPLLGGAHYLTRVMASRQERPPSPARTTPMRSIILTGYGEWSYLWQAPVLIWLAPFSGDEMEVYVPWSDEHWFWPRYDLHDASFGWQISLLVLLLPWSLYRFRDGGNEAIRERLTILAVGIAVAFLVFPVRFRAYGFVSAFPRYLLYLPVLIASLALSPIVNRLEAGKREQRMLAFGIVLVLSALFVRSAVIFTLHDRYTPLSDVFWVASHPGTRFIPAMTHRAGPMFDQFAAQTASVDVYGGFDTWIYPIMGVRYQRDLHFVDAYENLRPDVEWIVVDRAYQVVWGKVDRTSKWRGNMFEGQVSERDIAFMERLHADPRYETVMWKPDGAQAIFRRRFATIERPGP